MSTENQGSETETRTDYTTAFKAVAGGVQEIHYFKINDQARKNLRAIIEAGQADEFIKHDRAEATRVFAALSASKQSADQDLLAEALSGEYAIWAYHDADELDKVTGWLGAMNDAQRAQALSGGHAILAYYNVGELDKVTGWLGAMNDAQRAQALSDDNAIWAYHFADELGTLKMMIAGIQQDVRDEFLNQRYVQRQLNNANVDIEGLRRGVDPLAPSSPVPSAGPAPGAAMG